MKSYLFSSFPLEICNFEVSLFFSLIHYYYLTVSIMQITQRKGEEEEKRERLRRKLELSLSLSLGRKESPTDSTRVCPSFHHYYHYARLKAVEEVRGRSARGPVVNP